MFTQRVKSESAFCLSYIIKTTHWRGYYFASWCFSTMYFYLMRIYPVKIVFVVYFFTSHFWYCFQDGTEYSCGTAHAGIYRNIWCDFEIKSLRYFKFKDKFSKKVKKRVQFRDIAFIVTESIMKNSTCAPESWWFKYNFIIASLSYNDCCSSVNRCYNAGLAIDSCKFAKKENISRCRCRNWCSLEFGWWNISNRGNRKNTPA